jgi:hypothetical protein
MRWRTRFDRWSAPSAAPSKEAGVEPLLPHCRPSGRPVGPPPETRTILEAISAVGSAAASRTCSGPLPGPRNCEEMPMWTRLLLARAQAIAGRVANRPPAATASFCAAAWFPPSRTRGRARRGSRPDAQRTPRRQRPSSRAGARLAPLPRALGTNEDRDRDSPLTAPPRARRKRDQPVPAVRSLSPIARPRVRSHCHQELGDRAGRLCVVVDDEHPGPRLGPALPPWPLAS